MSIFLLREAISRARSLRSHLGFVRNPETSPRRFFSVSSSDEDRCFVVSYLVNSLGISPKAALAASKRVKFDSSEKPDKTVEFFKANGFTHAQLSRLARIHPNVLVCNVEKTILPKFEFLASHGISVPELAKRLSHFPSLLRVSLAKQIKPSFEFFRDFFPSNEMMMTAITRYPEILTCDVDKYARPNIATLRDHGVPKSRIVNLFVWWPQTIKTSPILFREIVDEVKKMGFDPLTGAFITAVYAMTIERVGSSLKWEGKVEMYKEWGCSEEEVMQAFRKWPWFMVTSEDKMRAVMEFLVAKMGLKPCELLTFPHLFGYSLEKRVIPRVLLYQVLMSRGLLKRKVSVSTLAAMSEKRLLAKLITPYAKEAPDLLKLYREKSLRER